MKDVYECLSQKQHYMEQKLADLRVEWKFIRPRAPHFGGLWEAAVEAVKRHLAKIVKGLNYTFEDYCTLLTEIEAILNSRPLTLLSSGPTDFTALTPSHFITGDMLLELPKKCYIDASDSLLNRWRHIQKLQQQFWKRWHRNYLNQLQTRTIVYDDKIVMKAEQVGNAYYIEPTKINETAATSQGTDIWHKRLGHASKKIVEEMKKEGLVIGMTEKENKQCESCMEGKMCRKNHPLLKNKKANEIMEFWHIDLIGPIKPQSRNEKRIYIPEIGKKRSDYDVKFDEKKDGYELLHEWEEDAQTNIKKLVIVGMNSDNKDDNNEELQFNNEEKNRDDRETETESSEYEGATLEGPGGESSMENDIEEVPEIQGCQLEEKKN
ncbi:hypothetical protein KM043_015748 [Ampulex compressa]|nr:hypothetical protein KM043_015748 [Ampulex compressa]